jgi:hypothetical protein
MYLKIIAGGLDFDFDVGGNEKLKLK